MIGAYIFVGLYLLAAQWLIRRWITTKILFKVDEYNPYRRKCKKCGQWQSMYDNGRELSAYRSWWEEIYPLGNDPNCKCKKYIRE
jgi:hypothetical protein